jgi:hypothetical protein
MANTDLEKYAKALDRWALDLAWLAAHADPHTKKCHHEVPWPENGGSERHDEASLE